MSAHDTAACLTVSLIMLLEGCACTDDAALANAAVEEVRFYVCREGQ